MMGSSIAPASVPTSIATTGAMRSWPWRGIRSMSGMAANRSAAEAPKTHQYAVTPPPSASIAQAPTNEPMTVTIALKK